MAASVLNPANLEFKDGNAASLARLAATANTLTLTSAGGNGVTLSGLATPAADGDAATKAYVESVAEGLHVKESVRAATTAAGTLASDFENGKVVDGVTLATGDRILIKNQTESPAENGIYTVNASGTPTRATDFDADADVEGGAFTFVEEGTVNEDTGWVLVHPGAVTVGSTPLTFSQFSGAGQVTAGTNLTKTGNTIDMDDSITLTKLTADEADVGTLSLGDGSITDDSGAISFGDEDLTTTGTLECGVLTAASGSTVGTLILENGSITDDSNDIISFGDNDLSTTGTLGCGVLTAATGSAVGNLTLANGSITDSSGAISFGDEDLTTTGDITAGSVTSSSDQSLKQNVKTLGSAVETVQQLRGVSFEWKESGKSDVGVIAQEVESVVPELVSTNKEGLKSVAYGNIVAILIESTKQQQAVIDQQKNDIAELKAAVAALQAERA